MGVDAADVNRDGRMDIMTLDMMPYDASVQMKSGGEDSEKVTQIKKRFGFEDQFARNALQIQTSKIRFEKRLVIVDFMRPTGVGLFCWKISMEIY